MGFLFKLRLYSECFKIGKFAGLIARTKYLCGKPYLEDLSLKSLVILVVTINSSKRSLLPLVMMSFVV